MEDGLWSWRCEMSWLDIEQQKVLDQMNQDLYDSVWKARPLNIWKCICDLPSLFEVMNFGKIITDNLDDTQF